MSASIIIIFVGTLAMAIAVRTVSAMSRKKRQGKVLRELEPLIGPALKDVSSYYNFSHYITESERQMLVDKYLDLFHRLRQLTGTKTLRWSAVNVQAERLTKALSDTEGFKRENNNQFIRRELERNKVFFDTVLRYPLDAQQREAVVSLEDNVLVISSAGSGKTMTTVGKVRYLIDKQGVAPSRILLITFTRKAAESLSERLGEKSLKCVTFHKLALDIIADVTGHRPAISDSAMPAIVYHDLMDNNKTFRSAIVDYILSCRYRMPDQFEYHSREEYIAARRKFGVTAYYKDMDGRPVFCKSDEESRICDYLGRHGIKFRYEEKYEFDTVDSEHRQYCPDFSIYFSGADGTPHRIYLEHFAVNESGRCPGWFTTEDERKYLDGIEWKRSIHNNNGTTLIETSSANFHSGDVFRKLSSQLKSIGIDVSEDNSNGLARELARQEQSILDMLTAFHFLLRSKGETTDQLLYRVKAKDLDTINGIIIPYMSRYDALCREKGVIDFTEAIIRATELCRNGHRPDYDYILVDEFQDISIDRYRFLQSLRRESPLTKLFCVGDDWQSIYRFAGSDIALFKRFSDYFGYTKECRMETTYRFGEPCVSLSSRFILTNKGQKEKTVRPFNKDMKTELHYIPTDGNHTASQSVGEIIASIPDNCSIYLLGRYGNDVNVLNGCDGFFIRRGNDGKVSVETAGRVMTFMTVHQSKGLESDYVILLNCNGGTRGFPSEMADNPILNYVLSEPDSFEYSEERRVLYVALTRAKHCTYVLYDKNRPSPFISEFVSGVGGKKDAKAEIQEEERCPLCKCGRRIVVKRGKAINGNPYYVYACSNEIYGCDYRTTKFVNLNRYGKC